MSGRKKELILNNIDWHWLFSNVWFYIKIISYETNQCLHLILLVLTLRIFLIALKVQLWYFLFIFLLYNLYLLKPCLIDNLLKLFCFYFYLSVLSSLCSWYFFAFYKSDYINQQTFTYVFSSSINLSYFFLNILREIF